MSDKIPGDRYEEIWINCHMSRADSIFSFHFALTLGMGPLRLFRIALLSVANGLSAIVIFFRTSRMILLVASQGSTHCSANTIHTTIGQGFTKMGGDI